MVCVVQKLHAAFALSKMSVYNNVEFKLKKINQ